MQKQQLKFKMVFLHKLFPSPFSCCAPPPGPGLDSDIALSLICSSTLLLPPLRPTPPLLPPSVMPPALPECRRVRPEVVEVVSGVEAAAEEAASPIRRVAELSNWWPLKWGKS